MFRLQGRERGREPLETSGVCGENRYSRFSPKFNEGMPIIGAFDGEPWVVVSGDPGGGAPSVVTIRALSCGGT